MILRHGNIVNPNDEIRFIDIIRGNHLLGDNMVGRIIDKFCPRDMIEYSDECSEVRDNMKGCSDYEGTQINKCRKCWEQFVDKDIYNNWDSYEHEDVSAMISQIEDEIYDEQYDDDDEEHDEED